MIITQVKRIFTEEGLHKAFEPMQEIKVNGYLSTSLFRSSSNRSGRKFMLYQESEDSSNIIEISFSDEDLEKLFHSLAMTLGPPPEGD